VVDYQPLRAVISAVEVAKPDAPHSYVAQTSQAQFRLLQ
jgi:hypothetical protein